MTATASDLYRSVRAAARRVRDDGLAATLADESLRFETRFRDHLMHTCGVRFPPDTLPPTPETTAILRARGEWVAARDALAAAGLPRHHDGPKNWDTRLALAEVLATTTPGAAVLDAGAELYSTFLPALYAYGYRRLVGVNLVFRRVIRRGPIRYEPRDITKTRFATAAFDAIACLSVVEHGVDLDAFFAEMARLLKPGGALVVSTDYWHDPIDTHGLTAFGAPIHIFQPREIEAAVALAGTHGLELKGPLALHGEDRVVHWSAFGLDYTFIALSFRRAGRD
jgi:SAM-dependent methyltransferase